MIIRKNNAGEIIFDFQKKDVNNIKVSKKKSGNYAVHNIYEDGTTYFMGWIKPRNYQNRMKGVFFNVLEGLIEGFEKTGA